MQSLYILLLAAACVTVFVMIRKEHPYVQRFGNTFNKLIQKFESWQMLR